MTSPLDRIFWRRRCRAFLQPFSDIPAARVVGAHPVNRLIPLHKLEEAKIVPSERSGYFSIDLTYEAIEVEVFEHVTATSVAGALWKLARYWRTFLQIHHMPQCERWRFGTQRDQQRALIALQELMSP